MKSQKLHKPALLQIGERIYHRRVVHNLVTKDIASKLSLSPEAFRNIEKGNTDISLTTLFEIARVLKINPTELIRDL